MVAMILVSINSFLSYLIPYSTASDCSHLFAQQYVFLVLLCIFWISTAYCTHVFLSVTGPLQIDDDDDDDDDDVNRAVTIIIVFSRQKVVSNQY